MPTSSAAAPLIGRRAELSALDRFYRAPGPDPAGLLFLYGRLRVGKTRLIAEWLQRHPRMPLLYWTVGPGTDAERLASFSQALLAADPREPAPALPAAPAAAAHGDAAADAAEDAYRAYLAWEAALRRLVEVTTLRPVPLVVVVDEFTELVAAGSPLAAMLKGQWDLSLREAPGLRLILTGSRERVMERDVLSYSAPMYGRASAILHLCPLHLGHLAELFPNWSPRERVALYAVTGGIPGYLELFVGASGLQAGLARAALAPGSPLREDAVRLVRRTPARPLKYEDLLRAIAAGRAGREALIAAAGSRERCVKRQLRVLEDLGLVEREQPLLLDSTDLPLRWLVRYRIRDPYLHFYYACAQPQQERLESGDRARAVRAVWAELPQFIDEQVFPDLCREWLEMTLANEGQGAGGPADWDTGYRWTSRMARSVRRPLLAASRAARRVVVLGTCWGERVARGTLEALAGWGKDLLRRREGEWHVDYVACASAGFTSGARGYAERAGIRLVELGEIDHDLQSWAAGTDRQ